MISDDPRARFIIAQYFIEQGRLDEARVLLRTLNFPETQAWADKLENGEPVDTTTLRWEPDMVRPMPPPKPRNPQRLFKPGRFAMSLFLAFMLVSPFLQIVLSNRAPHRSTVDDQTLSRSVARVRAQGVCSDLVDAAIATGTLERSVGSCMEWSFKLPESSLRDVDRCHEIAETDHRIFKECIVRLEILPDGLPIHDSSF